MKKFLSVFVSLVLVLTLFVSCNKPLTEQKNDKLNVVATLFPQYDFSRQIGGDKINVKLLLPPGSEAHTYEPTPSDMIAIQNADVFIYVGGENDSWLKSILENIDTSKIKIIKMMDVVTTVEEEIVEGMETQEEEDEAELDEHIWTSPKNAIKISKQISDAFCEKDSENTSFYKENLNTYLNELDELDLSFKQVVDSAKNKTLIFGDRFPFRYFADEYGLKYYAAFPGCSSESEPTPQTVAFLIDKVKNDNLPVVFYIEFSTHKTADTIAQATGAKTMLFHSCHNVSSDDMENGATYISLMKENLNNLKIALN